jgi:hypothetical protein
MTPDHNPAGEWKWGWATLSLSLSFMMIQDFPNQQASFPYNSGESRVRSQPLLGSASDKCGIGCHIVPRPKTSC